VSCVHDNANNITAALNQMKIFHLPCFAHTLQLSIKDAMDDSLEIRELISRFRDIVSYYHHSTKASDHLEQLQQQYHLPKSHLVQDVVTRWSSTWAMLDSVIRNRIPITHHLLEERTDLSLAPIEWEVGKELHKLLHPFKIATEQVQLEQNTSAAYVPILSHRLVVLLEESQSSTQSISQFSSSLLTSLQQRNFPTPNMLWITAALDPRFKRLDPLPTRKRIYQSLISMMNTSSHLMNESIPQKKQENEDLILWGRGRVPSQLSPDKELDSFLYCSPELEPSFFPLSWWKANASLFPRLARLAQKYLSIPATSAPAERIFSLAGQVVSDRRARLDPEIVDQLIFLRFNALHFDLF